MSHNDFDNINTLSMKNQSQLFLSADDSRLIVLRGMYSLKYFWFMIVLCRL